MIYPIHLYGMPVLRKKAADIDKNYDNLDQLIDDMYATLYQADGVGLAAPQIGKSIRLVVIDATNTENKNEPVLKDFKTVLINPYIIMEDGDEWEVNEGCLSLPNLREDINRKSRIRLQYCDRFFNIHDEYFDGMKARIIQHEIDHLDGILFVDRINPLKKKLLNGKLNAIARGKTDVNYQIRFPKK